MPRAFFEHDFAALTELIAAHVQKRVVQVAPRDPNASWKTIALWLVLIGLLTAVYYVLRAPGG